MTVTVYRTVKSEAGAVDCAQPDEPAIDAVIVTKTRQRSFRFRNTRRAGDAAFSIPIAVIGPIAREAVDSVGLRPFSLTKPQYKPSSQI